ncbi:MAG: hypothetical protein AAF645_12930 [Myxococcota bacterium]
MLLVAALGVLGLAVYDAAVPRFVRAVVNAVVGMGLLGASLELFRPSIAE